MAVNATVSVYGLTCEQVDEPVGVDIRKIMADMAASQLDNGTIPTIAPEYVRFDGGFEDTPEWGSAFIISPWYIYELVLFLLSL